ncbi:MAG: CpaF family protein [Acidobacteriota bacterium]
MDPDIRQELHRAVVDRLRGLHDLSPAAIETAADEVFQRVEKQRRIRVDPEVRAAIVAGIMDDMRGLGPIQALIDDDQVTEIMINGPERIYIEKNGVKTKTHLRFRSEQDLRRAIERMIIPTGRRLDEKLPFADFSLENGARVHAILPPLSFGGATVTIRKFLQSIRSVYDLARLGTLDAKMALFLEACIKARINILFSGPTGSGKTTTLEVLSACLDPQERIIIIEDAPELSLRQEHVVRLLTRPPSAEGAGEVTIRMLVRNCMRMRPTRIIVGEIRGEEAMDYLQAQTSGHRGCLAVIHASSPKDAVMRLETMALYAGLNLPAWAIRQQIASGLQLIVQHEQLNDGRRVVTHLTEVVGAGESGIELRDIFGFDVDGVADSREVKGRFVAKGLPGFFPLFRQRGVPIDERVFA